MIKIINEDQEIMLSNIINASKKLMSVFNKIKDTLDISEISFEDKKDAIAENNKPIVTKIGMSGMHRIGTLPKDISEVELAEYFGPSQEGDPDKVTAEWAFKVDGVPVGIWDYKGNRWSVGSTTADFEKVKEVLAKFGLEMTK